ncbi:hypothetical protein [Paracnuella aquatica]|uniref:hypothetical protein n=1 Tax=Paracnuella aquatica TaxID=2268757 RepID=UPI000DF00CA0|nr:hypothetical protein [Paracnuella aquatica]RPD51930.1 hypothetical protein DRJ53_04430 [Paracnuella aquatica]
MARIFTIFFEHENTTYNAMVSVRETHLLTEYILSIPDDRLERQLPSNRLIQLESGELVFVPGQLQPPNLLMQAISKAVAEHLQLVKS